MNAFSKNERQSDLGSWDAVAKCVVATAVGKWVYSAAIMPSFNIGRAMHGLGCASEQGLVSWGVVCAASAS
jgi:hypothetical protein